MRRGRPSEVLRYVALVELSGDPPAALVDRVIRVRERGIGEVHWSGGPLAGGQVSRVMARTYDDYAKHIGWHEGGPGDLLRKALAVAEIEVR